MNTFTPIIAKELSIAQQAVENTLRLLDEGCTIPFITRYRKEKTGGLDEVQITAISNWNDRLKELQKRKETITKTIDEQEKLTPELRQRIEACWDSAMLEDLYLPYKPRRRTRAQMARERGLEPLASIILIGRDPDIKATIRLTVDKLNREAREKGDEGWEPLTFDEAVAGAQDIIAEQVSEDEEARRIVRDEFRRYAKITSKVVKSKEKSDEAAKYSRYFDYSSLLKKCSSHQILAMRRGEKEGVLRVKISPEGDFCVNNLKRKFVRRDATTRHILNEAVEDAYKRLLEPSIENEFAGLSKEQADDEAIRVFAMNLRQLLLAAPLGQRRVMALDPGFANGCKTACLDEQGNLLYHEIIYPHPPQRYRMQAMVAVQRMVEKYHIEAIAIGNGTASRESEEFIRDCDLGDEVAVYVVSEDGASVYSASKTAREEFPDEDVTVRGAVSIGRRLMDPLAELVKIDPKSIGVGQYQHDVDQAKLKKSLDTTVESCVNTVGVNLNTASKHLLTYVSGLGPALAQNIVDYRREHGAFGSRSQLKKVPRLGPAAFLQCAGFLRIPNAKNPLDNSAVHPESYHIVEEMANDQGCTVQELMKDKEKQKGIDMKKYVDETVGLPTLIDIMAELDKPGRDPRGQVEAFSFDDRVHDIEDLEEGMVLPGIVTNITKFGAFVDIGVHQDGLVHVSQLANKFVSDPSEVVQLHQHVQVKVIEVDERRRRISLSMKQVD